MRVMIVVFLLGLIGSLVLAEEPATQPLLIDVSDQAAVEAAMGKDVIVQGVVREAAWSRTGKVMNIEFQNTTDRGLLAVVFERKRQELDAGFGGDLARALTGATVRLKGTLQPYGGRVESMKGRPQIIIEYGNQITILELATTQPAG